MMDDIITINNGCTTFTLPAASNGFTYTIKVDGIEYPMSGTTVINKSDQIIIRDEVKDD